MELGKCNQQNAGIEKNSSDHLTVLKSQDKSEGVLDLSLTVIFI